MSNPSEDTPSQAAWNRFADRLKEIGDKIVGPTGARGPRERAEGFRYLLGLLAAAQELEVEVDTRQPRLARMFMPTRRSFVADGIDTLYHEAKLDPERSYVFTVRRADDIFFSIVVYASDDEGMRDMVSFLVDTDLVFEDGVATIHIGKERPDEAQNWLELDGHAPFILTRQYFPDSVLEVDDGVYRPATMTIRCTDDVRTPEEYGPEHLSAALDRATAFLDACGFGPRHLGLRRAQHDSIR